jgi:hypothetical protein
MKNAFKVALLAAGLFAAVNTHAQVAEKAGRGIDKGAKAVGKGAKAVGRKTAEIASKGEAAVVDKKYDTKVGPGGQTIYIDKNSAYYYVNKKGHHIYVKESALKNKPM